MARLPRTMIADELQADFAPTPAVVGSRAPMLSWRVPENAASYRVGVSSSLDGCEAREFDLWDSGEQRAAGTVVAERYGGRALDSGTDCWWSVRVRAAGSSNGAWSPSAYFEVPPLSPGDWEAEWITWPATRNAGAL